MNNSNSIIIDNSPEEALEKSSLSFMSIINNLCTDFTATATVDAKEETNNDINNINNNLSLHSTHPSLLSSMHNDSFINNLFKEITTEDDQELISLLKNIKSIQSHQEQISKLQEQIDKLYEIAGKPQIIEIKNFDQLIKPTGVVSIEDQVNRLFFDAFIPTTWKLNVELKSNNINDCVSITLLNFYVKERTKELLNTYFNHHYSNIIYI